MYVITAQNGVILTLVYKVFFAAKTSPWEGNGGRIANKPIAFLALSFEEVTLLAMLNCYWVVIFLKI